MSEADVLRVFNAWDRDIHGDGRISKDELRKIMFTLDENLDPSILDPLFKAMGDNDGYILYEDFLTWVSAGGSNIAKREAQVSSSDEFEESDSEDVLDDEQPRVIDKTLSGAPGVLLPRKGKRIEIADDISYEHKLGELQVELNKLQSWVVQSGMKVVVLFEGRDAAGKGGAIHAVSEKLNPRFCRVVALPVPTEREKTQWYFQRYTAHLPAAGEIVLFDRSWYNRAGVEKVMGFCTDEEYDVFLRDCPIYEKMIVGSGIILRKYWLTIEQKYQDKRLTARLKDPTKHWKLSPMDLACREKWPEFTRARDQMFKSTHRPEDGAAWHVVGSKSKSLCHLNLIRHLLSSIKYSTVEHQLPAELPPVTHEAEVDISKVENPSLYSHVETVYHHPHRRPSMNIAVPEDDKIAIPAAET